jgi:hypothetical protein
LLATVTRVVQVALSVLVWIWNPPVFQPVFSPPSPACLTTKDATVWFEPRSTCSVLVPLASEHHLLSAPSLPSNAIAGPSVLAQAAEPDAGLPSARFVPRLGAVGMIAPPSVNEGGTLEAEVPQLLGLAPIVYPSVAPPAISE